MQSKKQSLFESFINIAIGYWISFAANLLILPIFGFHVSLKDNAIIGLLFTIVSIARSYLIRRLFNRIHRTK